MDKLSARNARIVARVRAGETLQSVADTFGFTREYIRQVALAAGVTAGRARRSAACREHRMWLMQDRLAFNQALGVLCEVCGKIMVRLRKKGDSRTCSIPCRITRQNTSSIRWKSPLYRAQFQMRFARYIWKNRKKYNVSQIRWAAKTLGFKGPKITRPAASKLATARWVAWRKENYR